MKNRLRVLSIVLVAAFGLAACGQPSDAPKEPTKAPTEATASEKPAEGGDADKPAEGDAGKEHDHGDYKACLVSDAGGWDDKSFNESAYEGLQDAIKSFSIKDATAESKTDADFKPNVEKMVQEGCNMIIGVGFLLEQPIEDAARANPKVNFGLVDSAFTDNDFKPVILDNARPLLFDTVQAAYLAGYVSAGMSKTKKIGTYGGMAIPSVQIFMDGFADGAARWNKDNNDTVQVLGWDKEKQGGTFAGNFDDVPQGKTITEGLIAQGADVIMPVAGPLGNGTAAAAKEKGNVMVVWVDSDGALSAPDHADVILTSVVKEIGASVKDTIKAGADGSYDAKAYVGTLANGGVRLADFHKFEDKVPAKIKDDLKKIQQEIIDGKTVVESPSSPK